MKTLLVLIGVGGAALVVQGGIATFLPPPWCPDFAFLIVLAMGLVWDAPVAGLFVAALLGFGADLLSGSLLGQNALFRLLLFVAARTASRRVNIRGAVPLACFVAAATVVYGLGMVAITSTYMGGSGLGWSGLADLLRHAAVNALFASPMLLGVQSAVAWASDSDAGRRYVRLDAGQGSS